MLASVLHTHGLAKLHHKLVTVVGTLGKMVARVGSLETVEGCWNPEPSRAEPRERRSAAEPPLRQWILLVEIAPFVATRIEMVIPSTRNPA